MSESDQIGELGAVAAALVAAARPLPKRALVLDDTSGELADALEREGLAVVSLVFEPEVAAQLRQTFAGRAVDVRSGDLLCTWGAPRQVDLFEPFDDDGLFEGAPFPVVLVDAQNATIPAEQRPRLRSEFRTARNRFGRDVVLIERGSQLAGADGRLVFACRPDLFAREIGVVLSESVVAQRGPHLVVDGRQADPPRVVVAETDAEANHSIRPRPGVQPEKRWNVLIEGLGPSSSPWVDRREIAAGLSDPADALGSDAARRLVAAIEEGAEGTAAELVAARPGRTTACGFRNVWLADPGEECARPLASGDDVRDWAVRPTNWVLWPYERAGQPMARLDGTVAMRLAPHRPLLESRRIFGDPIARRGLRWWEHAEHYPSRIEAPQRVICATRGTHNHAALLTRSEQLASSSAIVAPTIDAESAYLLLGLLNSSLMCFWFKHTAARRRRFEITVGQLLDLPLPGRNRDTITAISRKLEKLARQIRPLADLLVDSSASDLAERIAAERAHRQRIRGEMVFWQEELDWAVYAGFGLVRRTDADTLPQALEPHQRAFLSARSHPPRAALIEHDSNLKSVERGNYKRPFSDPDFDDELHDAAGAALAATLVALIKQGTAMPIDDLAAAFGALPEVPKFAEILGESPREWLDDYVRELNDANPVSVYSESGWAKRQNLLRSATAAMRREVGDHGEPSRPVFFKRSDYVDARTWSKRGRHDVLHDELVVCRDLTTLEGRLWVVRRPKDPRTLSTYESTLASLYLDRSFHVPVEVDDPSYWAVATLFQELRAVRQLVNSSTDVNEREPHERGERFGERVTVDEFARARSWVEAGRPHPIDDSRQLDIDRLSRMKNMFIEQSEWTLRDAVRVLRREGWPAVDVRRTLEALVESGRITATDRGFSVGSSG